DSKNYTRQFEYVGDGFIEIKNEWQQELPEINNIIDQAMDIFIGKKEFNPLQTAVYNPDKRRKKLYLPSGKKDEKKTIGFSWAPGEVRISFLKEGGQYILSFTDSKNYTRQFECIDDGFIEIKSEWQQALAEINNIIDQAMDIFISREEFNPLQTTINNPNKRVKSIPLPLGKRKKKGISFSWAQGEVRISFLKKGEQYILSFTDSKNYTRQFECVGDGFIEIKSEWQQTLDEISNIIDQAMDIFIGREEYNPLRININNPDKKRKYLNLPSEKGKKKQIGFNWAQGCVKISFLRVKDKFILSFTDSRNITRQFEWIKDGLIEIITEESRKKIDIEQFHIRELKEDKSNNNENIERLYLQELLNQGRERDKKDKEEKIKVKLELVK
ncbi:hypothetical protein ACFL52_05240, partial [Candidatus Margulisiibacteriota bacterium]